MQGVITSGVIPGPCYELGIEATTTSILNSSIIAFEYNVTPVFAPSTPTVLPNE